MKYILPNIVLVALGLSCGIAAANPGYVEDSGASVVRTGSGSCLRTGSWTEGMKTPECGGAVAAVEAPVELAAVEPVIRTELKPINLKADALFAFDSATLTASGQSQLNAVLDRMPEASALKDRRITITGFTDRLGPDSYNQNLSEQRAQAVRDYLVSKGLNDEIVDVRGLGSTQPLVSCEAERGPALINCLAPNRRTTIEFSAMEVLKVEK